MKRTLTFSFAIFTAAFVGAAGYLTYQWFAMNYRCSSASWGSAPFSSPVWQRASQRERYLYVNDLLASGMLVAKTRKQIVETLGIPDEDSSPFLKYAVKSYPTSECLFDSYSILVIRLDQSHVFQNAYVHND
jgi:hypothetical protein